MSGTFEWLRTSPERIKTVIEEISFGSEPKMSFYALLATSSLIASFGLIANSTAVIIGAMLVSPLMTPILGIALALVRGDTKLLGRAVQSEALGVVLAIGIAAILGLFPLALDATPEMLARTQPNLLDLLVAVLAGFAGTYAIIDVRLSPALPGVAIAVAIVPPLSNTGLCLALGAYRGAYGSFLLFFANFLAILLVSSGTFIAAGMAPKFLWKEKVGWVRRFGLAAVGFLVVGIYLTSALAHIVKDRYLRNTLSAAITKEFFHLPATSLSKMIYQTYEGKLYVLATVRSPKVIPPDRVKIIQDAIAKKTGRPTELIIRCVLAKDISATGSTSQVTAQNLDGFFLTGKLDSDVLRVQEAEQTLREMFVTRPDLTLTEVDLLYFAGKPVILATIQGSRVLIPAEIQRFEKGIQERLKDPRIHLLTRNLTTVDVDDKGRILYDWSHFWVTDPEKKALMEKIETAVLQEMKNFPNVFATNVDAAPRNGHWGVRVEAVGPEVISARDVRKLEKAIAQEVKVPVKIYLWSRAEAMVTSSGYSSLEEYTKKRLEDWEKVEASGTSETQEAPAAQ